MNRAAAQIEAGAAFIETNANAGFLRGIHQRDIQLGARHRVDELGLILAIGHERQLAGNGVHHASAHRDEDVRNFVPQACLTKRVNATRGKCQVDRAAGADSHTAHVGPALVKLNRESALRQRNREQRTGQS